MAEFAEFKLAMLFIALQASAILAGVSTTENATGILAEWFPMLWQKVSAE